MTCIAQKCGADQATAGTPCTDGGGKVCDGAGSCVACNLDADCGGTDVCKAHACGPPPCHNGVMDTGETDVDCGGACAAGGALCARGKRCGVDGDCATGACVDSVCCGSACAGPCLACNLVGTEGTCAPIVDGADPASECPGADTCNGQGACRCQDGMLDGAETGMDCGGGTCAACGDGLGCKAGSDCQSHVCAGNLCAAPTCGDATKNGAETGVDCGGGCPTGCPNGGACSVAADCDSGVCTAKVCQPAVCGDNVRGGAEQCDDGNTAAFDGCTSTCLREAAHLLISEVEVTPTASEFVEIYNPTGSAVDLSKYYLADYNTYYLITQGLGAPNSSDFRVHFPAGASIPAHGFVVVSLHTATNFQTAFGMVPDFDFSPSDPNAPDMVGEFGASAGLTDTGEMLMLFYWDGSSPHVQDVDYVTWGSDATVRVDKSGVSAGGVVYANDTPVAAQSPMTASGTYSSHRCDTAEASEAKGAGNGLTGHDETSESGATAWRTASAAKPQTPKGPPPAGLCP